MKIRISTRYDRFYREDRQWETTLKDHLMQNWVSFKEQEKIGELQYLDSCLIVKRYGSYTLQRLCGEENEQVSTQS